MYTGNIVKIERDENPNSPTYGTEREIVELSEICQNWQCRMVEIERETSGGVTMVTYEDKNENAPTFGKTITIASTDTTAKYLEMYSRCEQLRYHEEYYGNSGYKVATNIDANPNSNTYQQVVENVRTLDLVNCEKPNTNPIEEIETHCKLIDYASGQKGTNGVEVVEVYDMNPYSTTYGEKLREYERQSEDCAAPETTPNVIKICEYCEVNTLGKFTGKKVVKQKDINIFSEDYTADFQSVIVDDPLNCPKPKISIFSISTNLQQGDTITFNERRVGQEDRTWSISLTSGGRLTMQMSGDFSYFKVASTNARNITAYNLTRYECPNDMTGFALNNSNLTSVSLPTDMSNVFSITRMFSGCSKIVSIDFSGRLTSELSFINSAFSNCALLEVVNFDGCDLSGVTVYDNVFFLSYKLTTIYARGCNQATIDLLNQIKPSYANLIY